MVAVRLAHAVDRLSWGVGALGLVAGVALCVTVARPVRKAADMPGCIQMKPPAREPVVIGNAHPGTARQAKLVAQVSEPMTRLPSMPLLDYVSVAGPLPKWGEATVATEWQAGAGGCGKVMLYVRTTDAWWSLHLGDSGYCATPSAADSDATIEVMAEGPMFLANGTLQVKLETRFSSNGETSTWHTTTHCQVEASGVPTCTHAVIELRRAA